MGSLLGGGPPVSTIQGRNDKEEETDTEGDGEGGRAVPFGAALVGLVAVIVGL